MPMKTSTRFVNAAILNCFTALVLCTVCEFLALSRGNLPGGVWNWQIFGVNFVISWCAATILGMIPGIPALGFAFASKFAKPSDGLKFGLLVNIPINTIYSIVLDLVMSIWSVCLMPVVLFGAPQGGPIQAALMGALMDFPSIWVVCYIVTFLLVQPIEKLARRICNDPAPEMPPAQQ